MGSVGQPHCELRRLRGSTILCSVLPLFSIALCTGCGDRLTGPQAVQLVDAVASQSAITAEGRRQLFWDIQLGMLGGHESSLLRAASGVTLRRGGQGMAYRGLVLEFVRVPPSPLDCLGTRRNVTLWSDDGVDGFVFFGGGNFSRRIEPKITHWRSECDPIVLGPEPYLEAPKADSRWVGTDGEGDISPGVAIGDCPFLTPDAAGQLRERRGVTCELARYDVRFHAQVRPADYKGIPLDLKSDVVFDIELRPTEIIGVRMTIHCDGTERTKQLCPRSDASRSQP